MHALTPLVNCVFNVSITEQFAARLAMEEQQPKKCDKAAEQKLLLTRNAESTVFRHWRSLLQYQYHSTLNTLCMIFALERRIIGIVPRRPRTFCSFPRPPARAFTHPARTQCSGCVRRHFYILFYCTLRTFVLITIFLVPQRMRRKKIRC